MEIRLDKYLADMGIGSRSQVKQYIRKKQILVNGNRPTGPEQKITPDTDTVSFQGQDIGYTRYEYYLFYKPGGCVSAVTDRIHKTVLDYFPKNRRKGLFPVGRLDLDTEGLLLITNDGLLAHRLLSPRCHVDKTYYARIRGAVTQEDVLAFAEGVDIGEDGQVERTMPGILEVLTSNAESEIRLTIQEGKYHQVKRMFLAVGKEVTYLRRERMGTLVLDMDLKPGEYRLLTDEEKKGIGASGLA